MSVSVRGRCSLGSNTMRVDLRYLALEYPCPGRNNLGSSLLEVYRRYIRDMVFLCSLGGGVFDVVKCGVAVLLPL